MKSHILILLMLLIACAIISTIKSGSKNKVLEHLSDLTTTSNVNMTVAGITDTYYNLLKHFFVHSPSIGDVNNGKFNVLANTNFHLCTRDSQNTDPRISNRCNSISLENFVNNAKMRILNNIYTLNSLKLHVPIYNIGVTTDGGNNNVTHVQMQNYSKLGLANVVLLWTAKHGLLQIKNMISYEIIDSVKKYNDTYNSMHPYVEFEVSQPVEHTAIEGVRDIKEPSNILVKLYTVNFLHSALHSHIANINRGENQDYLSENPNYLYSNVFFAFKKTHLKKLYDNNNSSLNNSFDAVNGSGDKSHSISFNITNESTGIKKFQISYNTNVDAANTMSMDINLDNIGETICIFIKYDIVQIVKYSYTKDGIQITKKQKKIDGFVNISFNKEAYDTFVNTGKCICKLYIPALEDPVNTNLLI
jgi:hypothetical protein